MEYQIRVKLIARPEEIPIKGNAMDSGDPDYDAKVEREIARRARLTVWAWAAVECRIEIVFNGYPAISGSTHLGACSYRDSASFLDCPYWADMLETAWADAMEELRVAAESGAFKGGGRTAVTSRGTSNGLPEVAKPNLLAEVVEVMEIPR